MLEVAFGSHLGSSYMGRCFEVHMQSWNCLAFDCSRVVLLHGWLSKLWSLFGYTLNIRCRIIVGIHEGTIILITTHILQSLYKHVGMLGRSEFHVPRSMVQNT